MYIYAASSTLTNDCYIQSHSALLTFHWDATPKLYYAHCCLWMRLEQVVPLKQNAAAATVPHRLYDMNTRLYSCAETCLIRV